MTFISQKSDESVDNSFNGLRELGERWQNRLICKGLPEIESYLKGRWNLCVVFSIRWGIEEGIYLAVFDGADSEVDNFEAGNVQVWNYGTKKDGHDNPMLVNNVEQMQLAKGIFAARVRLKRFNAIDDIWGGPMYVSLFDRTIKVFWPFNRDREIDFLVTLPVQSDEFAGHNIKRRSKIMDGVSENQGELLRHWLAEVVNPFSVFMYDQGIRLTLKVTPHFDVKIRDMAFGPINL